jgi:hypothetical protein
MKNLFCVSIVGGLACAMFAAFPVRAATIDLSGLGGDIFFDHFPGTTLNAQWTPVTANGGAIVVGTDFPSITSAEIYGGGGGNDIAHIGTTSALNFSASPNDWWAQVTFLMPVHGGTWTSTNTTGSLYRILSGQQANNPSVFGIVQGIDLRAVRVGAGLWSLGWYGDDDVFRTAEILADNAGAGFVFSNTQKYTVSILRKSDGMVDIYFDQTAGDGSASELIATKALILGANPDGLTSGDWSGSGGGYILVDRVSIQSVPESSTVVITGLGAFAMGFFPRQRKSNICRGNQATMRNKISRRG